MLAYETSGDSQDSPSEALAAALSSAISSSAHSARTHVIVHSVSKTAHGWHASVDVVSEPKPVRKESSGARLKKGREPEGGLSDAAKKRLALEAEKIKQHEEVMRRNSDLHFEQVHDIYDRRNLKAAEIEKEYTYLYIELVYEDIYSVVAPRFNFDSVHYMPPGALWDESRRHFPDIELQRAAHHTQDAPIPSGRSEHPAPSKKSEYTEELTDE